MYESSSAKDRPSLAIWFLCQLTVPLLMVYVELVHLVRSRRIARQSVEKVPVEQAAPRRRSFLDFLILSFISFIRLTPF